MQWESVCPADLIPINAGAAALVDGIQIAIFRVGGEIFAIDNYDPIGDANVLARGIVCNIKGELCVASPLYKQHFSLRSGQCLEDENVRVNTYGVRINGGHIEIQRLKREAA
jgi:nitrite reductase (NADH) small subunit